METTQNNLTIQWKMFFLIIFGLTTLYWSVIPKMVLVWWNDPNFSHGMLVPLFSGYLIWERRGYLKPFQGEESASSGLLFILLGVMMLIVGKAGGELFMMRSSIVLIICGLFRILFGKDAFRKCLFPLLFLFFMVPIPYIVYDVIAFPLKKVASRLGEYSLDILNIPVFREGNIIHLPNLQLEVADACSGIRSLMSLMAMATAFAYMTEMGAIPGGILLLFSVPVAICTNSFRIFITGITSYYFGQKTAEGFFHDFSGWIIFISGSAVLVGLGILIRFIRFRGKGNRP